MDFKKLIAPVVLAFGLSACCQNTSEAGQEGGSASVDASYKLPDYIKSNGGEGNAPRIFEFTPKSAPHMTCVALVEDYSEGNSLSCFPKQQGPQ